jgi:hypothetical protein
LALYDSYVVTGPIDGYLRWNDEVRDNIFLLLLLQLLLQSTGERRFSRTYRAGGIDWADPVGEHVQAFLKGFVDLIGKIQKPRVRGGEEREFF